MEEPNLSDYSDAEIRDMIYKELQRLISEDPARFRKNMANFIATLLEAGEIGIPARLLTIKTNQLN